MGVSYWDFWDLSPRTLHPFIKAFELSREYEDVARWEQGLYIRLAMASVQHKDNKYPEKPFSKHKAIDPDEVIKQRLMAHVAKINSRFKEG